MMNQEQLEVSHSSETVQIKNIDCTEMISDAAINRIAHFFLPKLQESMKNKKN